MASTFAHDLFQGFDVDEDSKLFLAEVFASPHTPADERNAIFQTSLLSGYDDWNLLLRRATVAVKRRRASRSPLEAADLLAFISDLTHDEGSWANTDRLMSDLRKLLSTDVSTPATPAMLAAQAGDSADCCHVVPSRASKTRTARSPFWASSKVDATIAKQGRESTHPALLSSSWGSCGEESSATRRGLSFMHETDYAGPSKPAPEPQRLGLSISISNTARIDDLVRPILPPSDSYQKQHTKLNKHLLVKSPYFDSSNVQLPRKNQRRPAGRVSAVPFPPLTASSFGLVQEKLAHEPFWLLIAVTFLIKTSGRLAIPAFYEVRERFPTPEELADPASTPVLTSMIRHLGLSVVRTAAIQRYAQGWITQPPKAGVFFRVKGYDERDMPLGKATSSSACAKETGTDDIPGILNSTMADAWEIGHLTQGKYALDSWRIFCRDQFLLRAKDWQSAGAPPEFQPEWVRVQPHDKELRACLRWMWMKEGWEWDPETGEKSVLRAEMEKAVNEGRVEYDNTGGLTILDKPQSPATRAAVS